MRVASFNRANGRQGFTILEIMIAMFIFALVLTAIYATWTGIMKGTASGIRAANEVQRSRIAIRSVEDALLTAVMYNENMKWYYFVADTKGDMAALSFVSRLPASFPGVGRFGGSVVRRVSFYTQSGSDGRAELVMSQVPMLLNTNNGGAQGYSIVLARDVSKFELAFFDLQKKDWVDEWKNTNALPALVQVTLGLGKAGLSSSTPEDVVTRIISLPASAVGGLQAGPGPTGPGGPGSGAGMPGLPGGGFPGRGPGGRP
jgi:type II secretion system protein J